MRQSAGRASSAILTGVSEARRNTARGFIVNTDPDNGG